MLNVVDLQVSYGPIKAVKGVSFHLEKGELVSILGANGAGKTSTLFGIMGVVTSTGQVTFKEQPLSRKNSVKATKNGLVLCPENRRLFPALSVEENLKLGTFARGDFKKSISFVHELFPILKSRAKQIAGSLSGGEQQMLAVGRALMSDPELLILDEPSLGLAPVIVDELFAVLKSLLYKTSILLVEQNALKALSISNRAYIMQNGEIIHEGRTEEILHDDTLRKAYLGM